MRLNELAQSPPPEVETGIVTCYEAMPPPSKHAEYVCLKCNRKTIHSDWNAFIIQKELPEIRRLVSDLNTYLPASLDESGLCKKCSKGKSNQVCLTLQFTEDPKKVVNCDITPERIRVLRDFVRGDSYTRGERMDVTAMDKLIHVLIELLKLDPDSVSKPD